MGKVHRPKDARRKSQGGTLADARAEVRNLRQWTNELLREHQELMKRVKAKGCDSARWPTTGPARAFVTPTLH